MNIPDKNFGWGRIKLNDYGDDRPAVEAMTVQFRLGTTRSDNGSIIPNGSVRRDGYRHYRNAIMIMTQLISCLLM